MQQKELEILVHELEDRLDRLRTLYEQYFLGFEKLEPMVPRKDVERRFAILRKEQIRNTAIRFRFNVATQKFNTYSMYWGRICRQIEEGTYKRHVARAEKRFGKAAARGKRELDDLAIDVDMAELEGADMDAILAEADAAAAAIERDAEPDTVPPPPPSAPLSTRELGANGNAMRPAPLPAGMKPRVVLRKVGKPGDPAPSTRDLPAAPVSTRDLPAAPARDPRPAAGAETPRRIAVATPASPMASGAQPPDLASQRKIIVRPRLPGNPESAGKMPVAQPRAPLPSTPDAGSHGRIAATPPASSPRFPMPPPPASARKIPAPTSSQNLPAAPDSEPSASSQRKSVPPGQKVRVPLPSQLGRTTKKE